MTAKAEVNLDRLDLSDFEDSVCIDLTAVDYVIEVFGDGRVEVWFDNGGLLSHSFNALVPPKP
jgi:hypothetical protein